jgi:hypothetical protein
VVPAELVQHLVTTTLDALQKWNEDNDCIVDLVVCSAAVMAMSKWITFRLMNSDENWPTLQ